MRIFRHLFCENCYDRSRTRCALHPNETPLCCFRDDVEHRCECGGVLAYAQIHPEIAAALQQVAASFFEEGLAPFEMREMLRQLNWWDNSLYVLEGCMNAFPEYDPFYEVLEDWHRDWHTHYLPGLRELDL